MKVPAIRVGMCPLCHRAILDTQRHLVKWEGTEAIYYHQACLDRTAAEGEGAPTTTAGGRQKAGH